MRRRAKADEFNLAFLDVMACGLGAVILILIIIKFNANSLIPSDEIVKLKEDLAAIENQRNELKQSIDLVADDVARESATQEALKVQIEQLKVQQDATRQALLDKVAVVADLEDAVVASATHTADDPITLKGGGEENYLLGLQVKGRRIGILLDKSASMTNENLLDVIKTKMKSGAEKSTAPKWQRTKRIAKWLLARLPDDAKVSMVAFSNTAKFLGKQQVYSANQTQSMKILAAEVDKLIPEHGTNLQIGLETISKTMPDMTHLYLVTDGLPTLGNQSSSLKSYRKCKSFFGTAKTISGECRLLLFQHAVKNAAPRKVETNIILLPLEGDPQAPQAYWEWSALTGGIMISPASTWP
ncbi:Secreted protein, containing von Willebrand factor (VWF) type A domain [hydrothermal vent metagenome]|uniref:Secreted protein, containing von Willebrand factor (VWF) type A domain n=1 Tax=hydrothermal vent metagenome TaxID=652676 RepID=A0A3B1B7W0_9ZZZZ